MSKYDVIVVGAGPAGIFACIELIKKSSKTKILLLELGDRIEKRKKNDVMKGFGGAGTYSDGKLHYTPKLSHEHALHLIDVQDYQKILDQVEETFKKFGVEAKCYPKNWNKVEEMVQEAILHDIDLVVRRTQHVGTDKLLPMMKKIQKFLEKSGVKLKTKTDIKGVVVKENKAIGVVDKNGKEYLGEKVLLCPGRYGTRWLQEVSDEHGIEYEYDKVEIGVRVEFPSIVMKKYADALYEVVFQMRTQTFDDLVRTFCSCPNGYVSVENYGEYVCVNGCSNSDHRSKNSNFALLCKVGLTEPVENTIAYAKSIAEVASTIGGGKPIIQRLADFRVGRRSTWPSIKKSLVYPSLMDVTPGDIAMALPYRIVTGIIEGLEKLDELMPGLNSGSTLLYAPEVKLRSSKVKVTPDMQTTLKNLYVAGDASGISGSVTGAAATGIMAARGILK